jgi:hypothetical protein
LEPGTTLSAPVSPFYDGDNCLTIASLAGLKSVFEAGHSCKKSKVTYDLSTIGMAAQISVSCSVCGQKTLQLHPDDSTKFNRTVYVAREMSGRPSAVDRCFSWLGVRGNIVSKEANGSLKAHLGVATERVYKMCEICFNRKYRRASIEIRTSLGQLRGWKTCRSIRSQGRRRPCTPRAALRTAARFLCRAFLLLEITITLDRTETAAFTRTLLALRQLCIVDAHSSSSVLTLKLTPGIADCLRDYTS